MDVVPGKAVYTPLLNHSGGLKSDLTITRMTETSFRIVTGGSQGGIDGKWFRDNLPEDGSAHLEDKTSSLCTVGVWGPRARFCSSLSPAMTCPMEDFRSAPPGR